jgi:hypothetical protein
MPRMTTLRAGVSGQVRRARQSRLWDARSVRRPPAAPRPRAVLARAARQLVERGGNPDRCIWRQGPDPMSGRPSAAGPRIGASCSGSPEPGSSPRLSRVVAEDDVDVRVNDVLGSEGPSPAVRWVADAAGVDPALPAPPAVEPSYERYRSGPRDATVASGASRAPGGEERPYAAQDRLTWARRDPQRHLGRRLN